jgi:galactose mutarotase-like enzyme
LKTFPLSAFDVQKQWGGEFVSTDIKGRHILTLQTAAASYPLMPRACSVVFEVLNCQNGYFIDAAARSVIF